MFVMLGLNKISNYDNIAGWVEAMGVSGAVLPLDIALEVFGGFCSLLRVARVDIHFIIIAAIRR
jgi:putative oxidoreductase